MILAQGIGRKRDQSPLGRTVQLLRMLRKFDMNWRMDLKMTGSRIDILSGSAGFVCKFARRWL